jgi:hypothetical protein
MLEGGELGIVLPTEKGQKQDRHYWLTNEIVGPVLQPYAEKRQGGVEEPEYCDDGVGDGLLIGRSTSASQIDTQLIAGAAHGW